MNELRKVNLEDYVLVGEGGIGKTYASTKNPEILLKVNKASMSDEATMKRELEQSRHVLALGISTPRMYEIVRVNDGFGQTFERIKDKRSLSRICADDPRQMNEAAAMLATEGKKLHATPCDTHVFPSRKELVLKAIDAADFADEVSKDKMRTFVQGMADETTCLHGDFQSGNLIVAGDGKPYWIDLGWFGYGSPWFDLGHLYLLCQVYSQFPTTQNIFHMSHDEMKRFWEAFATAYSGNADHADFNAKAAKFAPLDVCLLSYLDPHPKANQMFAHVVSSMVENYY